MKQEFPRKLIFETIKKVKGPGTHVFVAYDCEEGSFYYADTIKEIFNVEWHDGFRQSIINTIEPLEDNEVIVTTVDCGDYIFQDDEKTMAALKAYKKEFPKPKEEPQKKRQKTRS